MRTLFMGLAALLVLAAGAGRPAAADVTYSGISGFDDPAGFTLNANPADGFGGGAQAHGVPQIVNGGTLHLTTTQGATFTYPNGLMAFIGDEATSAFFNNAQDVTHFSASFV